MSQTTPQVENKELLEEYLYKNVKYKETLIEERKNIDEKYENVYIKYLEGLIKIDEINQIISPFKENMNKHDNLKRENDKQMEKILTDTEQLKTVKENLKEENTKQCNMFVDNMNKVYENLKKLPETFTNVNIKNATKEAEIRMNELLELKESLTIKVNKIKQEFVALEEYETPSNVNESLKQINAINYKHFGDITKNTSTISDIQKNINSLKKQISEVESKLIVNSN